MKKTFFLIITFILAVNFFSCANNNSTSEKTEVTPEQTTTTKPEPPSAPTSPSESNITGETTPTNPTTPNTAPNTPNSSDTQNSSDTSTSKFLVAYFSCTGTTEKIAENIAQKTSATLHKITPKIPYTEDDLKYYTDCRADKEQKDSTCRPEISNSVENFANYDVIFIGYPIWHGQAPKIIYTFVEKYDFSGKTVVPFCTSGSSPIGNSDTNLHNSASNANWKSGKRFSKSTTENEISKWIKELNLKTATTNKIEIEVTNDEKITTKLIATLADNSSAKALAEKLQNGSITINMHDYGNFEKVGELPWTLPRNDMQISTDAGDIILYLGNNITIYYDKNNWNFTQLGKLDAISNRTMTKSELKKVLGNGNITAVIKLEN